MTLSQPSGQMMPTRPDTRAHRSVPLVACLARFCTGNVSRASLLFCLLPLSVASLAGTFVFGIYLFPGHYDWRTQVMSHVISPVHNPHAYWLPALGIAAASLLCLPLAGYIGSRLGPIMPRLAGSVRVTLGIGLILLATTAIPLPGMGRLHETLARAGAAAIVIGLLCCSACALKDRFHSLGGRRLLGRKLALCWISLAVLPLAVAAGSGILLLGRNAHLHWAVAISQAVRPTVLWQLAFWEWLGVALLFGFCFLSVGWLPAQVHSAIPELQPTRRPRHPALSEAAAVSPDPRLQSVPLEP
jgi:hypothetical protein